MPGTGNYGNSNNTFGGKVGIMGSYDLSVYIRAIEQTNGSDLMSSPSLTVLDGKTAVIKVAQLLRYPQAYGDTQSNVGTSGTAGGGASTSVAITAGAQTCTSAGVAADLQRRWRAGTEPSAPESGECGHRRGCFEEDHRFPRSDAGDAGQ
jgi:general secretion pathway protein D